jgi:hypothetical protein
VTLKIKKFEVKESSDDRKEYERTRQGRTGQEIHD